MNRRKKAADHARWAGAFAQRMEEVVRRYPEQWGNLYPVWCAPPDADEASGDG